MGTGSVDDPLDDEGGGELQDGRRRRLVGGGGSYCVAVGEGDMWLGLIWRSRNCGSSDVNRVSGERELINIIFCPSIGAHYIQISSDVVLKERTKNN